jgi:hypothetical protein
MVHNLIIPGSALPICLPRLHVSHFTAGFLTSLGGRYVNLILGLTAFDLVSVHPFLKHPRVRFRFLTVWRCSSVYSLGDHSLSW